MPSVPSNINLLTEIMRTDSDMRHMLKSAPCLPGQVVRFHKGKVMIGRMVTPFSGQEITDDMAKKILSAIQFSILERFVELSSHNNALKVAGLPHV